MIRTGSITLMTLPQVRRRSSQLRGLLRKGVITDYSIEVTERKVPANRYDMEITIEFTGPDHREFEKVASLILLKDIEDFNPAIGRYMDNETQLAYKAWLMGRG